MNIAFRVDASAIIGTGHFMRCLTLAGTLKVRGASIRFLCRHLPEYLRDMLSEKGYEFILLSGSATDSIEGDLAHSHWLESSQSSDAQAAVQALSDRTWDWLVVDHYALDARWESALRQSAKQIFVIDDIADRQHDCDILLDQNFYADMDTRYTDKIPGHCRLLLGPRYALLRDEFYRLREKVKPRTGPVKRLLVFFGGIDAENYTGRVIDILSAFGFEKLVVDVVIGEKHPYRRDVELLCAKMQFACHVQTTRMAELMASADMAIGAGGSATWERCCLGLPTLAFSTANNQFRQINDAAAKGLLYVPEITGDFTGLLSIHLAALTGNNALRTLISHKAMSVVDGRGALRVVRKIGCTAIKMRLATSEDSEKLFGWRNHILIRSVSRNSEEINWSDHQKWFTGVLSSSDRVLLIGELENVPVGVVRFDIQDNTAEVSIYVIPETDLTGAGQELLQSAEHWIKRFRPEIREIKADVLGSNERSHRFFLGADYYIRYTAYSKKLYDQS